LGFEWVTRKAVASHFGWLDSGRFSYDEARMAS
jgi:hypothetical protein